MAEDVTPFTLPPDGRLSEQVVLPDHRMAAGLLHIEGAGVRVCTWDGERLRHMSQAAARRFASEMDDGPHAAAFRPVADALRNLADRVDEINAMVAANRQRALVEMPVEGHA